MSGALHSVRVIDGDATVADMDKTADEMRVSDVSGQRIELSFPQGRKKVYSLYPGVITQLVERINAGDEAFCRAVGDEINAVGGYALMSCVYWLIRKHVNAEAAVIIERTAWKGIGRWAG